MTPASPPTTILPLSERHVRQVGRDDEQILIWLARDLVSWAIRRPGLPGLRHNPWGKHLLTRVECDFLVKAVMRHAWREHIRNGRTNAHLALVLHLLPCRGHSGLPKATGADFHP